MAAPGEIDVNAVQKLGFAAMQETITSGAAIDTHLNALALGVGKGGDDLYSGALRCLLDCHLAVRSSGVAPRFEDKDLDAFMQAGPATMAAAITQHGRAWDVAWLSTYTGALVQVVNMNRTTLKFSAIAAKEVPAPAPIQVEVVSMPAPGPVDVNVKSMPVPTPLEMRIIGMPERVTESTVSYDQKGDIKATKQTEKDAM